MKIIYDYISSEAGHVKAVSFFNGARSGGRITNVMEESKVPFDIKAQGIILGVEDSGNAAVLALAGLRVWCGGQERILKGPLPMVLPSKLTYAHFENAMLADPPLPLTLPEGVGYLTFEEGALEMRAGDILGAAFGPLSWVKKHTAIASLCVIVGE